jgi:hypothetical protein
LSGTFSDRVAAGTWRLTAAPRRRPAAGSRTRRVEAVNRDAQPDAHGGTVLALGHLQGGERELGGATVAVGP